MHRYTVVSGEHDLRASGLGCSGLLGNQGCRNRGSWGLCCGNLCGGFRRVIRFSLSQEMGTQLQLKMLVCGILCIQESPCRD